MADFTGTIRAGEARRVYGQEPATNGTITIQSVPTPTITLYDATGTIVAGWNGITVPSGQWDVGALVNPRIWYIVDTTTPTILVPGLYTAEFTFRGLGSDTLIAVYRPSVGINVTNAYTLATYDPTTTRGQLRLKIQDTDITSPRWYDNELDALLLEAAGSVSTTIAQVYLAAAKAIEAEATDASRLATVLKLAVFGDDESKVPDKMQAQAKMFRRLSGVGFSVSPQDDRVFTMTQGAGTIPGTMDVW